jgi:hypothetical protein
MELIYILYNLAQVHKLRIYSRQKFLLKTSDVSSNISAWNLFQMLAEFKRYTEIYFQFMVSRPGIIFEELNRQIWANTVSVAHLILAKYSKFQNNFYTRKVLTVPLTNSLHIGHFRMAGAQSTQQARWPQGRKAMDTFFSIQILHRIWSFRLVFSCRSDVSSVKQQNN